ncbi:MAG: hypothetical protein M1268_02025 [Patescibacteria group bacterium]|nr:hypothetical protein [Patescibacteria group bacterium]
MYKQIYNYFKKHPMYNSLVHVTIGVGIGILITYPFIGAHPLRWGGIILLIGIIGHIYPVFLKK